MQTFLHGRDLIGDLAFSKEEVETILDVAWDLKRKPRNWSSSKTGLKNSSDWRHLIYSE